MIAVIFNLRIVTPGSVKMTRPAGKIVLIGLLVLQVLEKLLQIGALFQRQIRGFRLSVWMAATCQTTDIILCRKSERSASRSS